MSGRRRRRLLLCPASSLRRRRLLLCPASSLRRRRRRVGDAAAASSSAPPPYFVCLDGSPPAYHLSPGFGSGVNNWLVQIEGGGWCNNVTTCLARKITRLGSSKQMVKQLAFSGILSNTPPFNPGLSKEFAIFLHFKNDSGLVSFSPVLGAADTNTTLHIKCGI